MRANHFLHRRSKLTSFAAVAVIAAFVCAGWSDQPPAKPAPAPTAAPAAGLIEATLVDGSKLKIKLVDERIEFETAYGKLQIPTADLQRIDFQMRIPAGDARRVEVALKNLGSEEFQTREAANAELIRLGERSYPALLKAAGDPDMEIARRANELLDKLRETIPLEHLEARKDDGVSAGGCQLVGRVLGDSLRVQTLSFGEQRLPLSDVRSLRLPGMTDEERDQNAVADPGTLRDYANEVGKTFSFKVTVRPRGARGGLGAAPAIAPPVALGGGGVAWIAGPGGAAETVWGTDVYTIDSSLQLAAVHAGVLRPGQTGTVKVKILGVRPAGFKGSTRHGVTSLDYGAYPAFSIVR
jgi:hypothetical protein